MRRRIGLGDNIQGVLEIMSEGNPGALGVLVKLLAAEPELALFKHILPLDDMNIRASQIWVAYKDWAGGDLGKLTQAIEDRDQEMVDAVNRECVSYGEVAVRNGASFERK